MPPPPCIVKLSAFAPAEVSFLMTRACGLAVCRVIIRTPERKRWRRSLSRSGNPEAGASRFGFLGPPKKSRQSSVSDPGLYIIPVEMSTLMIILPIAGRTDWKYPRHRWMPLPMSFVSLSVKKDLTLNGYLDDGSIRTTTLRACRIRRSKPGHEMGVPSYHNGRQDLIILSLLTLDKTL